MMKVLLCIVFSIAWPIFMWIFAVSFASFVDWNNYFVVQMQDWNELARLLFVLMWFAVVLAFSLQLLVPDKLESKS